MKTAAMKHEWLKNTGIHHCPYRVRVRWACGGGHGAVPAWAGCRITPGLYPALGASLLLQGSTVTPELIAAHAYCGDFDAQPGRSAPETPVSALLALPTVRFGGGLPRNHVVARATNVSTRVDLGCWPINGAILALRWLKCLSVSHPTRCRVG